MSWLKRKPRNRRLGRDHVLDVKLRSDQVRATRVRLAAIALGLTFATIFGFYAVWRTGQWALNRLIYENTAFAIQNVEVETDGVIAPAQLRRWAGVKPGENLLALDLTRVKRDLELVTSIRSVAVERVMPHTLRLRVAEREPIAQINLPGIQINGTLGATILQIDEDGYVMNLLEANQRSTPATQTNDTLPIIFGIDQNLLVPGRRVESSQARAALQLIAAFERSQMSGLMDIQSIDVCSPEILQITTSQGNNITFAVRDLERQLREWHMVHEQAYLVGKAIATLDLSVVNNSPATWTDTTLLPPGNPKPKSLPHTRKRNV
ncbi:MAG: putative cell division protein FtsQ [Pedosphaera sp.]|nr:putative cell division protein FtsQ [Pedosphaera sp.]